LTQKLPKGLQSKVKSNQNILLDSEKKFATIALQNQANRAEFHSLCQESLQLNQQFQNEIMEIMEQLKKVSNSMESQHEKVNQMSHSLMDMSNALQSTASLSETAVKTSKTSEGDAKKGGEVVNKIIKHMNKITQTVSKSAEVIRNLQKRSDEIVEIINVINEIAEQTNLLALNAAIEAAKAGPQGRGFAVVADQVRSLAEKTTHATKEIASTLSSIKEETSRAVGAMNEGIREIDTGAGFAVQAGVSLRRIVSGAQQVTEIISQIAGGAGKQFQISTTVTNLVKDTSFDAYSTWEQSKTILESSKKLEKQISKLSSLLNGFVAVENKTTDREWMAFVQANNQEISYHIQFLEEILSGFKNFSYPSFSKSGN
jgi:methyl-accepting chemotaxis protein